MGRFDNLEFDDKPSRSASAKRGQDAHDSGTPMRDAAFFSDEALAQFRVGAWERALQLYSRALSQDHTQYACWLGQIRCLLELEEYNEAVLWSNKAMELFPEHPELLAARAVASARMGLREDAMVSSDMALARKGATPFVWLARGEILLSRKRKMAEVCFNNARNACTSIQEQSYVSLDLARLLRRYKLYSQAMKFAGEAVRDLPRSAPAWLEQGVCQLVLGHKEAAFSLNQALQIDPQCTAAKEALTKANANFISRFLRRLFGG